MLIRVSGGGGGSKEYLEDGRKQGRGFTRDELDERVILAGDLEATDAIIQLMENDGERYLHITLAFKEDEVSRATMENIAREFEQFLFSAYRSDEYSFYAEAHLPKIKSYTHEQTGDFVERKPHIHFVVPKINLLTGRHLNPLGVVEKNQRHIDAFQEYINHKYGLASPKDHRRIEFTGESEMISRYKGDIFEGQNQGLKADILEAMLARRIDRYEDFKVMLAEYGELKTRNANKPGEYQNVKPTDQAKGVNLKDYVFSREFVELPDAEKRTRLSVEITRQYETTGPARKSPQELLAVLQEWHEVRAKEVKYINSGNRKLYAEYRAADPQQRRTILAERETHFYDKHQEKPHHGQPRHTRTQPGRKGRGLKRQFALKRTPGTGRYARYRKPDAFAVTERSAPQSLNRVRNLSRVGVVGFTERGEMLLPNHAPHELDNQRAESPDPLRRAGNGRGRIKPTGRQTDNVSSQILRDHVEHKQIHANEQKVEFQEIKLKLDARRLLAELSQTHGVILEKHEITKGKDGGDRIKCGTRNLNVSDYLVKELNLPWPEAARIMRETYARQQNLEPTPAQRQEPRRSLWGEFQEQRRTTGIEQRTLQWEGQRSHEKERREAIKTEFYAKRSRIQADRKMKPAERKAALSIARMERLAKEAGLRERIKTERDLLKAEQRKPAREHYREFLTQRANAGDELALAELRRMRPEPVEKSKDTDTLVKPAEHSLIQQQDAPIRRDPVMSYQVHSNGDVTYKRDGHEVIRDAGRHVQMLQQDATTIETGLRLAQQKFGNKLALSGPQDFQEKAAIIAADAGMNVEFTDERLNKIMADRKAEIEGDKARIADARKRAQDFAKVREDAREKSRAAPLPPPAPDANEAPPALLTESKAPDTDRSQYNGEVQAVDDRYVYTRQGRDIIRHNRDIFRSAPKRGDAVKVTYENGKATIRNYGQESEKGRNSPGRR